MEHFRSLEGPCVFIGNHMSTLETFVLPSMIQPWKDVTFVVKESLLKLSLLRPRARVARAIVVGRSNPRERSRRAVLSRAARRGSSKAVPSLFFRRARAVPFSTPRISIPSASNLPSAPGFGHSGGAQDRCVGEREPPQRFRPGGCQKTIHFEFSAPMRIEGRARPSADREFIIDRLGVWGREIGE